MASPAGGGAGQRSRSRRWRPRRAAWRPRTARRTWARSGWPMAASWLGSSSSPAASSAAGRGGVLAGVVAPERRRAACRSPVKLGAPAVGVVGAGSRQPTATSWLVPHRARRYPARRPAEFTSTCGSTPRRRRPECATGGRYRSCSGSSSNSAALACQPAATGAWPVVCSVRNIAVGDAMISPPELAIALICGRGRRRRPALAMTHVFRMWPVNRSLPRRKEIAAQTMRKSDGPAPARRGPRQVQRRWAGRSDLCHVLIARGGRHQDHPGHPFRAVWTTGRR